MKTTLQIFSFCLIIAVLLSGCKNSKKPSGKTITKIKIEGDTLSLSPDNQKVLIQVQNKDRSALWITNKENTLSKKIIELNMEDGVKSTNWSPDGLYVVFVVYNMEGHSPLTSSHVWVCGNRGKDLTEIKPLPPNQRFSSFDPRWASGSILIFRAMTLTSATGQKYSYNAQTKEVTLIK